METKKLSEKLLLIQEKQFRVGKDGKNPHFKSSYVTLDNLLSELLPILSELKIVVTHSVMDKKLITTVINIEDSNDIIVSEFPITQDDPQKIGSSITYGKRYNLGAIFNIITEVDDDGNSISGSNHKSQYDGYREPARTEDTPSGGTKQKTLTSTNEYCPECGEHCETKKGLTKDGRPYELGECKNCNVKFFVNRKDLSDQPF